MHHRPQPEASGACLRDQQFNEPHCLHLAQAPICIGDDARRPFVKNRQFRAGHNLAVLDRLHIIRYAHHTVRVVALEIRINETGSNQLGLVG